MHVRPQTVVLFHHFRRFLEAAEGRGIDVAPLKGAHLLTSVYPEGADRGPMSDVDFLVRPEQWDETVVLLRAMGFSQRDFPGRAVTRETLYEAGFYLQVSDKEKILFEPHRYFVQPARLNIDYDAVWARSGPSTFDGVPCRRLAVEDHILYAAVHLTTHFFNFTDTWMRDAALLFENGHPDLSTIAQRAVEWRITRSLWLMLTLMSNAGVGPDLTDVRQRLAPGRLRRLYLRTLVPDATGFRFKKAGLRLQEAVLWPAVFDRTSDFLRFFAYYLKLRIRDFRE